MRKAYKFNAVNELLRYQSSIPEDNQKFIMFLTIHCSYDGAELNDYLSNPDTDELKGFISQYNSLKGYEKNSRILRLYVIDTLQEFFRTQNFIPKFLPTIMYSGLGRAKMLHFTIIGTRVPPSAGRAAWHQNLSMLCRQKLVTSVENEFEIMVCETIAETDVGEFNPVQVFANSRTYKRHWNG